MSAASPSADAAFAHAASLFEPPPAVAAATATRARYAANPLAWAFERAGVHLWSRQRQEIEAVRDHRRVAVHSCHSSGKTAAAAVIAAWWIDSHEPGTAFVLTSAPTAPQVKALLWREIGRLHRRAGLPGRVNLTEWYLGGELVAFGRKPSEHDEAAFHGTHALYVLVIFDEASGIPTSLWTAAETVASNENGRILAIGNPDDPDSEFAKVCAPGSGWHVIGIGAADTPNFTGEDVPAELRSLLISKTWVAEREAAWGAESALYISKCLGRFPPRGGDPWTVIPHAMATRARYTDLDPCDPHEAGIDVGGGGDRTVFYERRGPVAGVCADFRDPDPMATVARLVDLIVQTGVARVRVDVGGIGWALAGRIRELSAHHNPTGTTTHHAEVVTVNFGARARAPRRFANRRAELWWTGRELSRLGAWDLATVSDDVLAELCAPRFEILDSEGRIKVEAKDEVIKRLGRSPDFADALLLAFDTPAAGTAEVGAVGTFAAAPVLTAGPAAPSRFGAPRAPSGGFGTGFRSGGGMVGPR